MKNKLLTTTAIAGLLITGNAFAQTTITGNLDLSYKAISNSNAKANSVRGLGKESQINVTNKGKLNNGMDYVVKIFIFFSLFVKKSISHPMDFPIQFFCINLTFSGQPFKFSRDSKSSSEYFVIFKNH